MRAMSDYPIRLTVSEDRKRNRLTVFFRLLLMIPHFIWIFLWGIAVSIVVVINWFATLIMGRSPTALHNFLATFLRYITHAVAYVSLLADEYPEFTGEPGYGVDLEIDPPEPQPRWSTFFRVFLAFPASTVASSLMPSWGGPKTGGSTGALGAVAFLGWFVSMVKGEMPRGMRDLGAYSLGYSAQAYGYLLLLTSRYPNSDPERIGSPEPLPEHPVSMLVTDDLNRSRLTVFFRWLLAIPHFIWLLLWGVAVAVAVFLNWIVTLVSGRSPAGLHRFLAAYVRYQTHVVAYVMIVGSRFPGFTGEPYDIDVEIAGPERQNRWITFFRLVLAFPRVSDRKRPLGRARLHRVLRLGRVADRWPDARGIPQPRGLRPALQRPAERLHLHPDRPLSRSAVRPPCPVRAPGARTSPRAQSSAPSSLPRSS